MELLGLEHNQLRDAGLERKVLSCILKSSEAWLVSDRLVADDFEGVNRAIYQAVDSLYREGGVPDPISVFDRLAKPHQKELDDLGGWAYIDTLIQSPIDPNNVAIELEKIKTLSTNRQIASLSEEFAQLAIQDIPKEKKIEQLEESISKVAADDSPESFAMGEGLGEWVAKAMENPAEIPGISTGFPELDKVTLGLQGGRMYVVGARKKIGKSMILMNWAKNIAIDQGIPVLFISTEHQRKHDQSRLLANVAEVWESRLTTGTFQTFVDDAERVAWAVDKISKAPFYHATVMSFNLQKIQRLVRKHIALHGVKVVFFDYIKLPDTDSRTADWRAIGNFADGLHNLIATKYDIPVVTACQVNRQGAQLFRDEGEVDSDTFAGSDIIAQAMDVGLVLRKLSKKEEEEYGFIKKHRILQMTDNRNGDDSYKTLLNFEGEVSRVIEAERI